MTGGRGKSLTDFKEFEPPGIISFIEELKDPSSYKYVPTQVFALGIVLTILTIFMPLPRWAYVMQFFFWRLMYDFGIGYLLYVQSNGQRLTKCFRQYADRGIMKYVKVWVEEGTTLTDLSGKKIKYKFGDYPDDFNTWIIFRIFVNIVLANDFTAYCVLCAAALEIPASLSLMDVTFYLLGLALMFFAGWSKSDAHRVIGNFAWYWGDFFFLQEADLTFDGVFQMFPHPMYTVGYSFYYGLSLVTQSYLVFYCSVGAHLLQMLFLALVESPHIEKMYGGMGTKQDEQAEDIKSEKGLLRWLTTRKDMILFFNLNVFRASDVFTILVVIYSVAFASTMHSWETHLAHFIVWRIFHVGVLGYVLKRQSTDRMWAKSFSSDQYAFDNWKKVFNLSLTMNHILFVIFACSCFSYLPPNSLIKPLDPAFYWFKLCLGMLLILLQIYVSSDVYSTLGDFGWFYGDFFLTEVPKGSALTLTYSGVYRYLNNPESVMGFCGYYGIAMIASSYRVGTVAVLCHVSQILFTHFVETPHMRKQYGETVRQVGGLKSETERLSYRLLEKTKSFKSATERRLRGLHSDSDGESH